MSLVNTRPKATEARHVTLCRMQGIFSCQRKTLSPVSQTINDTRKILGTFWFTSYLCVQASSTPAWLSLSFTQNINYKGRVDKGKW